MINIDEIKNQVKKVLEHSQNLTNLNVDQLIEDWYTAKARFIRGFNNELIYEYPEPVTFELSENARNRRIDEFIELITYTYNNSMLSNFIYDMRNCFFSNTMDKDYYAYDTRKAEEVKIQKGTKIVKAFKYFVENERLLTELQNKASTIIQENKVTGTLCISVHPLDFLSSSENNHNWRSCHALDGEYRTGNLSYMVDKDTCMVYLKSDKEYKLSNFPIDIPWNSKKWRVLLFVSNDASMLFLGRQYPFSTDTGANFITEHLLTDSGLFKPNTKWTPWTDKTIDQVKINDTIHYLRDQYIPVGGVLKRKKELIQDGPFSLQFNDLLQSNYYESMYCYMEEPHEPFYLISEYGRFGKPNTQFDIGGAVKCLMCGKDHITNSETVLCNTCEEQYGNLNNDDFGYCSVCGRHFYLEDAVWVHDELLCPDCADSELRVCDECGQLTWKDEIHYDEASDKYLCEWCLDNRID